MFREACSQIRNAIYGVIGISQVGPKRVGCATATAFMIAPGVLATAAHFVHVESDVTKPVCTLLEAIRAPDVGQETEIAEVIAEDPVRDIALLRIDSPRSDACVTLEPQRVAVGTNCGSLGFPLAEVRLARGSRQFTLVERFQGAFVSAFVSLKHPSGREFSVYETDALMYQGSSGCPGFLVNGNVFGMHVRSRIQKPRDSESTGEPRASVEVRIAISMWVPSMDIIAFAGKNGVAI